MSTPKKGSRVRVTFEGHVVAVHTNGSFAMEAYTGLTNGMTGDPTETWLVVDGANAATAPTVKVEALSDPERDPAVATWDELRKQVRG